MTITLHSAAIMLGLKSGDSLRRQVMLGRLRAKKHGRQWFVTRREVERYRNVIQRRKAD